MKICDIVQFYSPLSGGVKRYIHDKQRFISARKDSEHLLIVPSDRDTHRAEGRIHTYEIKSPRLIGSRSYRMRLRGRRMEEIIRAEKPDLIEVGDPYYCAWVAARIGHKLNIPVVAFYHSDYPRALDRTLRRFAGPVAEHLLALPIRNYLLNLYNRMDSTIVATRRLRRQLEKLGIRGLVQIPLGTDTDVFRPRSIRRELLHELGLEPDTLLLLYAGRLAREKNIREMLAMMEHLHHDNRAYHLIVVGDGELHQAVREAQRDRSDVTWLPHLDSADMLAELYSSVDLLIHAGTCETFGIVSLEAQACGTRVVAVQNGGLDETLEGEPFPVFAAAASPYELSRAVRTAGRLHEPPETRLHRRQRIIDDFSWENTYARLFDLYENMCKKRRARSTATAAGRAVCGSAVYAG